MRVLKIGILAGIALVGIAMTSPSFAAGKAVGQTLQALAAASGQSNVGGLISGVIYGNTSNPSGNGNGVLPSLSTALTSAPFSISRSLGVFPPHAAKRARGVA